MATYSYPHQRLMRKFVHTVQPKPLSLKRPRASFIEDSVDELRSSPARKRYCPESVSDSVTKWVEFSPESESYRERHCRSGTLPSHSDGDPIPRRLTKSAPNMEYRKDAAGFALPPTPASTISHTYRVDAEDNPSVPSYAHSVTPSDTSGASTGSHRKKSLVENPFYRMMNLAANGIYMRPVYEELPENIAELVHLVRKDRDSPGPSPDQLKQDTDLYRLEVGSAEADVEKYFRANVFLDPKLSDSLQRTDRVPMFRQAVPDVGSKLRVSIPVPDTLYGYSPDGAFHQRAQLLSMANEMVGNSQGLMYPFLVIEFKADGPSGTGGLWVATNQCLGASASCVNIAERLNRQLRQCKSASVRPVDSTAFSIAMNGTEARLYISWKHDELNYYMQRVDGFLLYKPNDYIEFRKCVRNIIDWGRDTRLQDIQKSLESLLEENRKTASQVAKSRPPPLSDDAVSTISQKRKSPSSRGSNSKAESVQEQQSRRAKE